ncbi:hypothetical protein MMC28_009240 [Mycoblastus sanguinarius]|nr:hypothetical protein [Mycoblastus sanguinarius]
MSDYDKLTVIKLRDELVKRGLPKAGLKAALVQRLIEADARPDSSNTGRNEPFLEQRPEDIRNEEVLVTKAPAPTETKDEVVEGKNEGPTDDSAPLPVEEETEEANTEPAEEEGFYTEEREETPPEIVDVLEDQKLSEKITASLTKRDNVSETPAEDLATQQAWATVVLPANLNQPAKEPNPELQNPIPVQTQPEQSEIQDNIPVTQTSVTGEELLEDSRKRKRRSQSPPPSSIENTQKRLKADNARPHVELPEDSTMPDAESKLNMDGSSLRAPGDLSPRKTQSNGHSEAGDKIDLAETGTSDAEDAIPKQDSTSGREEFFSSEATIATATHSKSIESPIKPSPSDTRFKNLFTPSSMPDVTARQPQYPDSEDRVVSPALHPATSALYIRELMRPLKPENIKDHLASLATPANAPLDSKIVTEFFLDSIRTHCLVGFANISAASRARSGLHDRIWPNERDRRPLWADFVPEEKLMKWIDVEQNTTSGRGQASKRWEVVYEDEGGEIKAYLQTVGSNSGGVRAAKPARPDAGQGVQGAPSGPRAKEREPRTSQARPDNGKGFQALDDLFKSTTAKPKLYYLPAPKTEVNRRLDRLAAGRGGGRSDETRRYSFEEGIIVDKGPEFGSRGRGGNGYGGRGGGYSGGYRGRTGGYRGDGYRGDSWRDRRSV